MDDLTQSERRLLEAIRDANRAAISRAVSAAGSLEAALWIGAMQADHADDQFRKALQEAADSMSKAEGVLSKGLGHVRAVIAANRPLIDPPDQATARANAGRLTIHDGGKVNDKGDS